MRKALSFFSSNIHSVPAAEEQGHQDFIRYFCYWKRLEAVVALTFLWEQIGDARA